MRILRFLEDGELLKTFNKPSESRSDVEDELEESWRKMELERLIFTE